MKYWGKIVMLSVAAVLAGASSAATQAAVIEDFESGFFKAPWIPAGNGGFPGTPDPFINALGA